MCASPLTAASDKAKQKAPLEPSFQTEYIGPESRTGGGAEQSALKGRALLSFAATGPTPPTLAPHSTRTPTPQTSTTSTPALATSCGCWLSTSRAHRSGAQSVRLRCWQWVARACLSPSQCLTAWLPLLNNCSRGGDAAWPATGARATQAVCSHLVQPGAGLAPPPGARRTSHRLPAADLPGYRAAPAGRCCC